MIIRLPIEETKPYIDNLVDLLIPVLNSNDIQSTVAENAAICLGRMGINAAELVNGKLNQFIEAWCARFYI